MSSFISAGYIAWHGRYSAYDYAAFSAFMRCTFSEVLGVQCPVFKCDICKNDMTVDEESLGKASVVKLDLFCSLSELSLIHLGASILVVSMCLRSLAAYCIGAQEQVRISGNCHNITEILQTKVILSSIQLFSQLDWSLNAWDLQITKSLIRAQGFSIACKYWQHNKFIFMLILLMGVH